MEILRDYESVPRELKGAAIAIGNFDGVHRGHQAVLETAIREARRLDTLSRCHDFSIRIRGNISNLISHCFG